MRLLIKKKSNNKFPPPYIGDGKTAIAIGKTINEYDPNHSDAYLLENGKYVNCNMCNIIKDLENNVVLQC